jgi:predicted dehydrogenase
MSEIQLIAVADSNPEDLHRFVKVGSSANGYCDYREMFRAETVDLLSVCVPPPFHHRVVLEAVKAGVKAILCERPLAVTVEEAAEMVTACESAGVILAVNHARRWEPVYLRAKRLLAQGEIGRLTSLAGYYPGRAFTVGTHLFDLMRFFAGNVSWVSGDTTDHGNAEIGLSGYLRFRSGVQGLAVSGCGGADWLFELDLVGSRGRLRISGDGARLELARFSEADPVVKSWESLTSRPEEPAARPCDQRPQGKQGLAAALGDLLACLQSGGMPACSGRDGMAALEIAWALCESATRGHRRIDLPLYQSLYQWRK